MTFRLLDEFCGFGGSSEGAAAVPGVALYAAANHSPYALDVHALNHPGAIHLGGDIAKRKAKTFPYAELFWASPACPPFSNARGERVDFDASTANQGTLWAPDETDAERKARLELAQRRALMEEVPVYLRRMALRGRPVLAGVVENVPEARKWAEWDRWIREIQTADDVGYNVRVIALNAMHARPRRTRWAPQSRNRLWVAYSHRSLGRTPDWDRWLRPRAYCPTCDEWVDAIQTWKKPGVDMGAYGPQYVYRCPRTTCRRRVVQAEFAPAYTAIDFELRGERIGDKPLKEYFADEAKTRSLGFHHMAPKTLARVGAGVEMYGHPFVATVAGHTFERRPGVRTRSITSVLPTQSTTATEALVTLPMLVPVEGRDGLRARTVLDPFRTQTARNETALVTHSPGRYVVPPFIAELRGGHSNHRPLTEPLATVTASGNHHGLVTPPAGWEPAEGWAALFAYDTGQLRDHTREPLPTQTTIQGDALLTGPAELPAVEDCEIRMLEPYEIRAGQALAPDHKVFGTKRAQVRGYGNAVPPPCAEVLVSALVEAITGEDIDL